MINIFSFIKSAAVHQRYWFGKLKNWSLMILFFITFYFTIRSFKSIQMFKLWFIIFI